MQARGRLHTALSTSKTRAITAINGNIITLSSTAGLITSSVYKPFLIQDNKIARIINVVSDSDVEIDSDPGFVENCAFTPWTSRWVHRVGDKASSIRQGDLLVGASGDTFEIIAIAYHGTQTAVLGLWQIGEGKEPTSADTVIFTPTSRFHLLPKSDVDKDITAILSSNRLSNLSNVLLDESVREDIWATPTNTTRNLFVDISHGWFGQLEIPEQTGIVVENNTTNYVEVNRDGNVVVNTSGWNNGFLKVAEVITEDCLIKTIKQVWVKNTSLVIPGSSEDQYEVWRVNREPVEVPNGIIDTFTVPDLETFIPSKIQVTINGLEDYCFTEVNGTQIKFDGIPIPMDGDIIKFHYAISVLI